jgi:mRNA-degrading endonuclease RelE of RelBE toxin-antitoxin system
VGLKRYKIKFLKNVSKRDLPVLPKTIKSRVEEIIKERLTVNPIVSVQRYGLGDNR